MRYIPIPANLVTRVDDNNPLVEVVRQHARHLTDHGRLADSRSVIKSQVV